MNLNNAKPRADESRRDLARQVRNCSVADLYRQFRDAGVHRAYVLFENGEFILSHPQLLRPLQAFLELSQDFAQHEGVFIGREDEIQTLFFAFVHDTRRGLAQGGLRFWRYENIADVLVDGLRLAQGMTRKNALAGLWWGGGKGIIPLPPGLKMPDELPLSSERRKLFEAYGRFIASLGGVYYTAEDVGTKTADMDAILSQNRFTTCISTKLGGSGNPSPFTAQGVFRGMQAAWYFLTGADILKGVRVAVQGVGNVGRPLIELLDEAGAQIWITDVNEQALQTLVAPKPHLRVVAPEDIFDLDVDILAPCARGGVINARTIPRLKARLICGAANNILLEERYDPQRLLQHGISFVPDYVCNRMGITNCCDEWLGYLAEDVRVAAERVYPDTLRVLRHARHLVIPPTQAANELADIAASELHPILGHRGRRLIDHLLASNWGSAERQRESPSPKLFFTPALDEAPIRVKWEKQELFIGNGTAIAAAPISAASNPNLASLASSLLLDVRARALAQSSGQRPRRVLGSDHGGLALQLAIERSLPHEREEIGRAEFVAMCRDLYNRHDAAIREQMHQLGVGFDPGHWLDAMSEPGQHVVQRLFYALHDAGLIVRETHWAYQCPRCQTVLVASDVSRAKLVVDHHYTVRFKTAVGGFIETKTYFPELVLGAVALAVKAGGPYQPFAGQKALHPLSGKELPIFAAEALAANAVFLVPAHHSKDAQLAQAHGISGRVQIFDQKGAVCIPGYADLSLEEVRQNVLARLGAAASRHAGTEAIDAHRCRRCESLVYQNYSAQLFVKIETGAVLFRRAISNSAVQFSHPRWRERVLSYIGSLEPWCISRQQWWGNEIPTQPQEVLSTWFSLAAWSLQGAGWPQQPEPQPIHEVFVDPDLLVRWVIPSQIAALMITGRPVFQRVHVHGALHVPERLSQPRDGVREEAPDEERFLFKSIRRPMRLSLGNDVQPGTLIRRFGADALRLGYLLCVNMDAAEVATVSESKLRQGRKSVHGLVAKLTNIFHLLRACAPDGELKIADHCFLVDMALAAQSAKKAYEELRFEQAAHLLIDAIELLARYANLIAERRQAPVFGAPRAVIKAALLQMAAAFSPICPFLFEKIATWTHENFPMPAAGLATAPALEALVKKLNQTRARQIAVNANEFPLTAADRIELEDLFQKKIVSKE